MGKDEVPRLDDPEDIIRTETPAEGMNIITGAEFDSDDDTRTLASDTFMDNLTDDEETVAEEAPASPPIANVFQLQPPPLPCPIWDEISPLPAHAISEVIPEENGIRIIVKPCHCFACFSHVMSVFYHVLHSVLQQQEQEEAPVPPQNQNDQN